MAKRKYSRETIITALQNEAKRLGKRTLTMKEVNGVVPVSAVRAYFGSLGNALEAAGLERLQPGWNLPLMGRLRTIPDDDLFRSLIQVEDKLGHEPTFSECSAYGTYSTKPFLRRFGKWADTLDNYRKWKAERPATHPEGRHNIGGAQQDHSDFAVAETKPYSSKSHAPAHQTREQQLYGEPIDFRGLRHAPINEQGVVFLFGMVSRELGFYIEAIQQGFPDCEGKYLHDEKENRWARGRIEFEYKSSAFQQHGHDPAKCDFIVCWIHDWPDCPIEVIELREEIRKLPSQ